MGYAAGGENISETICVLDELGCEEIVSLGLGRWERYLLNVVEKSDWEEKRFPYGKKREAILVNGEVVEQSVYFDKYNRLYRVHAVIKDRPICITGQFRYSEVCENLEEVSWEYDELCSGKVQLTHRDDGNRYCYEDIAFKRTIRNDIYLGEIYSHWRIEITLYGPLANLNGGKDYNVTVLS